jgi:hypothetical protein
MVLLFLNIYLVLTVVLYIVKIKVLKMPINNFIIAKMLKKVNMKKQQETEILKEAIALLETRLKI